jgi:hypothetical protein
MPQRNAALLLNAVQLQSLLTTSLLTPNTSFAKVIDSSSPSLVAGKVNKSASWDSVSTPALSVLSVLPSLSTDLEAREVSRVLMMS